MNDPIYVESIKVSSGQFTVRTASDGGVIIEQKIGRRVYRFGLQPGELQFLISCINEYLHMRSME